ncbi:MAG: bifunctional folylpolyglutamate synthase/dihydrofolate synthase [Candidatus Woesearchaeota archaeon]
MNYNETIKWLYNKGFFTTKLGLTRVKKLANKVNNPQNKIKTIHVAGTNGKGSTSAFISQILIEQGYRVGVYTSPHLVDFRERFKINNKIIPKKNILKIFKKIKPYINDETFFEIITVMAFIYFAEEQVDFAIIEVGLGGRLDATNIIKPLISVITNISIDHTKYLGNTIEKIGYEKAGIIKKNIDVIIEEKNIAIKLIEKICIEKKCNLIKSKSINYKNYKLGLIGEFQKNNAEIAYYAIKTLQKKYEINENSIKKGLKNTKWPGRFEFIENKLLFDCAHNKNGAKTLIQELKNLNYKNITFIIGIMKDKDIKSMCFEFNKLAKNIIITKTKYERCERPKNLVKYFKNKNIIIEEDINKTISIAKKISKDNLIVACGSIYLIGELITNYKKLNKNKIILTT